MSIMRTGLKDKRDAFVCVCSESFDVAPRVSVSVEADELAVELSQRSGHRRHFLPSTPPAVVHLHRQQTNMEVVNSQNPGAWTLDEENIF